MGKRGPKPYGNIKIKWSPKFAYAIGLLATDGCLYNDGRHISFTTKDFEQAGHFKNALGLKVKIGTKFSGLKKPKKCFHIQFGDVLFYRFLFDIGLTPAKSKTISKIKIPDGYFFDFLRGWFDGDGSFYSYWDSRFRSSHMFYIEFTTASGGHVVWLQKEIFKRLHVKGYVKKSSENSMYSLKYAKKEAQEVIKNMYYRSRVMCLSRKKIKIEKALSVEKKQQIKYK